MKMIRSILLGISFLALALPSGSFAQTPAATTNGSVVITTSNTFQTVLTSGRRLSLTIQNNNTSTDSCWIMFGKGVTAANATKAKSIELLQGQAYTRYYPYIPLDEIEGTCASGSDSLYIDTE
jgi:hypothetical protein